jgi:hypothetical protein
MSKKSKAYLEHSLRVYELLVRECVEGGLNKITYGEVAEKCGGIARGQGAYLTFLQAKCDERHLPTITVFVVEKGTGLPGAGCHARTKEEVAETIRLVRARKWPEAYVFVTPIRA